MASFLKKYTRSSKLRRNFIKRGYAAWDWQKIMNPKIVHKRAKSDFL